ncbi:MAG: 30S ribosomal protein S20 [Thermoanaerobaculia bacterium]
MANNSSAEKKNRQSRKRQDRNRAQRSAMRSAVKKLRAAIASGDATTARESLPRTLGVVDATARKGVVHANAAARTKSRLTKAVDRLG